MKRSAMVGAGSRSVIAAGSQQKQINESMLAPKREGVQQLTTGEISHSTENNANLPPSVARERGQGYYQKIVLKNVSLI